MFRPFRSPRLCPDPLFRIIAAASVPRGPTLWTSSQYVRSETPCSRCAGEPRLEPLFDPRELLPWLWLVIARRPKPPSSFGFRWLSSRVCCSLVCENFDLTLLLFSRDCLSAATCHKFELSAHAYIHSGRTHLNAQVQHATITLPAAM